MDSGVKEDSDEIDQTTVQQIIASNRSIPRGSICSMFEFGGTDELNFAKRRITGRPMAAPSGTNGQHHTATRVLKNIGRHLCVDPTKLTRFDVILLRAFGTNGDESNPGGINGGRRRGSCSINGGSELLSNSSHSRFSSPVSSMALGGGGGSMLSLSSLPSSATETLVSPAYFGTIGAGEEKGYNLSNSFDLSSESAVLTEELGSPSSDLPVSLVEAENDE